MHSVFQPGVSLYYGKVAQQDQEQIIVVEIFGTIGAFHPAGDRIGMCREEELGSREQQSQKEKNRDRAEQDPRQDAQEPVDAADKAAMMLFRKRVQEQGKQQPQSEQDQKEAEERQKQHRQLVRTAVDESGRGIVRAVFEKIGKQLVGFGGDPLGGKGFVDLGRCGRTEGGLLQEKQRQIITEEPGYDDRGDAAQKTDDRHREAFSHGKKDRQTENDQNNEIQNHKSSLSFHKMIIEDILLKKERVRKAVFAAAGRGAEMGNQYGPYVMYFLSQLLQNQRKEAAEDHKVMSAEAHAAGSEANANVGSAVQTGACVGSDRDSTVFDFDETGASWVRQTDIDLLEKFCPEGVRQARRHGHFLIGQAGAESFVAIPGRFLKEEQPDGGRTGFTLWQPMKGGRCLYDELENLGDEVADYLYGYWIARLDSRTLALSEV